MEEEEPCPLPTFLKRKSTATIPFPAMLQDYKKTGSCLDASCRFVIHLMLDTIEYVPMLRFHWH